MKAVCAVVVIGAGLSGCSLWPPSSGGGFAEHFTEGPGFRAEPSMGRSVESLNYHLLVQRVRFEVLGASGADKCLPGLALKAERQWVRSVRTLTAGLVPDAAMEIDELRRQLDGLQVGLDELKLQGDCRPSSNVDRAANLVGAKGCNQGVNGSSRYASPNARNRSNQVAADPRQNGSVGQEWAAAAGGCAGDSDGLNGADGVSSLSGRR